MGFLYEVCDYSLVTSLMSLDHDFLGSSLLHDFRLLLTNLLFMFDPLRASEFSS